jgi:hypothetical protein
MHGLLLAITLGHSSGGTNAIELEALWELAENPSPRVHQLFLDYALERPATTHQLRNRSGSVVRAVVGLDPAKRQQLEEMLLRRIQNEASEAKWREDCAWVAREIIRPGQALTKVTVRRLADALVQEADPNARQSLAQGLAQMAARLEPAEAAALARRLADALAKEAVPAVRNALAHYLVSVAARLGPAEAARLCGEAVRRLADDLIQETDYERSMMLAQGLRAVAARLEPAEAAALARRLADAMTREANPGVRSQLAWTRVAVMARLEPAEAAAVTQWLTDALAQEKDSTALYWIARFLNEPARLEPAEAAALARRLADALARETAPQVQLFLAQSLGAVAARLEPAEAARLSAEAARRLADALAKEVNSDTRALNPNTRSQLAGALVAVAARLEPAEAGAIARRLDGDLAKEKDTSVRIQLARALGAVAVRLEPAEAAWLSAKVTRLLTDTLARGGWNATDPDGIARALVEVAARLEPAEAARLLTDALTKEKNLMVRSTLVEGLGWVAARLEPAEAAAVTRLLADIVAKEERIFNGRYFLAQSLGAVAARLEPAEAASLLVDALAKETDSRAQFQLAKALGAVTTRIEPKEAASRSPLAARAIAGWLSPVPQLGPAAVLLQAAEPLPCRLSTQQLVDLLKMPTVWAGQAVFLELLANRYKRPFADVWEFVEWAQQHEPSLDFTSPPKRNPLS